MRIGILSDTHGRIHPKVYDAFAAVDVVLHAGDVEGLEILEELREFGEVHAVMGNCDFPGQGLAETWTGVYGGLRIAMTHGHLVRAASGSPAWDTALIALFKDFKPDLVIHGHTHRARLERHPSGVQILNPGAVCRPRFGSTGASVCVLDTGMPGRSEAPVFQFVELEYPVGR